MSLLYLEDESYLHNVSTKFQLDWPANNRSIAGSLFSQFLRVLIVFRLFKMLGNTAVNYCRIFVFRVLGLCFLSLSFLNTRLNVALISRFCDQSRISPQIPRD